MTPTRTKPTDTAIPANVRFQKIKADVHKKVVEALDLSRLNRWSDDRLKREIRTLAGRMAAQTPGLSDNDKERLADEVLAEAFGLGPIEPFVQDPKVSDILVNGPGQVYIERNGKLELTDVVFADNAHLIQLIQRIAARVGRRADESSPMVDARLADGSRVNAILPPLATAGPVLSIRRFGVRLTSKELMSNGTMPPEVLDFLKACIECRVSLLISGGTGSGKTTLLNVLSRFIPTDERLVTVEDTAELKLQQPHVVTLETRPANMEGAGEVKPRDLVRNALRMRPDRIIVGEVRGGEALDMLQAMNTGHEGSMTTIHANDTRDALTRLETMVMMAGFDLPVPVIRQYVSTAITVVVQLTRLKGGPRRVVKVSEIVGTQAGEYVMHDIFGFRQTGVSDGVARGEFYTTGHRPKVLERLAAYGHTIPEAVFTRRNYLPPTTLAPVSDAVVALPPTLPSLSIPELLSAVVPSDPVVVPPEPVVVPPEPVAVPPAAAVVPPAPAVVPPVPPVGSELSLEFKPDSAEPEPEPEKTESPTISFGDIQFKIN